MLSVQQRVAVYSKTFGALIFGIKISCLHYTYICHKCRYFVTTNRPVYWISEISYSLISASVSTYKIQYQSDSSFICHGCWHYLTIMSMNEISHQYFIQATITLLSVESLHSFLHLFGEHNSQWTLFTGRFGDFQECAGHCFWVKKELLTISNTLSTKINFKKSSN